MIQPCTYFEALGFFQLSLNCLSHQQINSLNHMLQTYRSVSAMQPCVQMGGSGPNFWLASEIR